MESELTTEQEDLVLEDIRKRGAFEVWCELNKLDLQEQFSENIPKEFKEFCIEMWNEENKE